jgi:hypothetical protein
MAILTQLSAVSYQLSAMWANGVILENGHSARKRGNKKAQGLALG